MLFDIRTIVAGLLGCYGVILIVTAALHDTDADHLRSGGWNINQWTGLGMLAAAVVFMTWTLARPIRTPEQAPAAPRHDRSHRRQRRRDQR
ncbi:hypothetical protein ABZ412_27735 [Nocardia sp. NPDC005746]|uniref:hypothetical protein n=1 Tax=Nocardia sp. NPDC005746 TaxID=3157062 RepID=UPI0033C7D8CB